MFVFKRNQIIITALVIMVAVAGYLSWVDSRQNDESPGFVLDEHGNIYALIGPDGELTSLFPEEYPAWTTTHDPIIAVSGDDAFWSSLTGLDISEIFALPSGDQNLTDEGDAIFVIRRDSSFVQNRLAREQTRSSDRAILTELINNPNVPEYQRAQAAGQMMEIQSRVEREAAAEVLIESKGFTEAYVRISDNSVDVVVSKEALTPAELAQIVEIIKNKTGMNETQIRVSPMRR